MSANARQQFDSTWRCHVAPKWTDVSLDAVRPADVEEWLLTKTRAVAMQCKTVLSRVMDRARFNEVTDNDPFSARLDLPSKGTTRPSGAHTPDELREIWLALWGMPMEPAFLLMAFGSCRVGESLGVRALEVTYGLAENSVPVAVVPISRKVGENGSVDPDGDLKTRESVRSVVLCGPMAKRLRDVASGLAAQGVEWLCDDGTGEPMGTHHFRDVFRRAVEGAGCRWMSPQTLRRSWETVAHWTLHLEAEDRERMMGHKLPGVTGALRQAMHDRLRPRREQGLRGAPLCRRLGTVRYFLHYASNLAGALCYLLYSDSEGNMILARNDGELERILAGKMESDGKWMVFQPTRGV